MLPRVRSVTYLDGYRLELRFTNQTKGVIDFRQRIVGRGGVFEPLEDIGFFRQVSVDRESGTLVWPNDVDFCPDVLYSLATGEPIPTAQVTDRGKAPVQPEVVLEFAST